MKRCVLLLSLLSYVLFSDGQGRPAMTVCDSLYRSVRALPGDKGLAMAENVPVLKLSETERSVPLPPAVNNARSQFMIPIFYQAGLECGQAASICYTLSYEFMRRRNQHYMWGYDFQYPSHFAWNFCNRGENRGVSFMETWQVVRTAGTPTVAEWGGWYSYGGPQRWMSGYDLYYEAMKNRISEAYAIPIDNEDGILTLKHWLADHLNGEATGGLANFYSTYFGHIPDVLPPGTPQAGKRVLTSFSSYVDHAQTIVGYNDSICWDYNGDGLYTNDQDLNGDGIVDVKDWEKGGVIFCNTFGTAFADEGYCFMPYRLLARLPAEGGIWNKTVYVPVVKDEVSPQITFKATIKHTSRNKIKLEAGIANNPNATEPEHIIDFDVFNYQGGDQYMQGGHEPEANKTLELGLDVSPLLNYAVPGQPCRFFLIVHENDPYNDGSGSVLNFSLMDYTSGTPVEQACTSQNVAVQNNATTMLSLVHVTDFTKPEIADSALEADAFVPYSHQLTAVGGKPPYRWSLTKTYGIAEFDSDFPPVAGNQQTLDDKDEGYVAVDLNFDFPFYGDTYRKIYISANGYIEFHHNTYNWPFMLNEATQVETTRMICPFRTDLYVNDLRVANEEHCATVFYDANIYGQWESAVQVAVKLHESGDIEFYYGGMDFEGHDYQSALYRGDAVIIQHSPFSGVPAPQIAGRCVRFAAQPKPVGLHLYPDGRLSGTVTSAYEDVPFSVTCYDNNDVATTKMINVTSRYTSLLLITGIRPDDGQTAMYAGDTVRFTVTIRNADTMAYDDGELWVGTEDPWVTLLDSTEYFGYIGPGNEYVLNKCITCVLDPATPDRHVANFSFLIDNSVSPVYKNLSYMVHSNELTVEDYDILNESHPNHLLDADESATVDFFMRNAGSRTLYDVKLQLRVLVSGVSLIQGVKTFPIIAGNEAVVFSTFWEMQPYFAEGQTFDAYIDVYAGGQFKKTLIVSIVGVRNCTSFDDGIMPDDFSNDNAAHPWFVDDNAYCLGHSLCSGSIGHNETCAVDYDVALTYGGMASFDYKVSTEANYDHLRFYIDGELKQEWSGLSNWTTFAFFLDSGPHVLTWEYAKDYSVHGYDDMVWIDNICLPDFSEVQPELAGLPDRMEVTLGRCRNRSLDTAMTLTNTAGIYALFETAIAGDNDELIGWVAAEPSNGSIDAFDSKELSLHFSSFSYAPGDYHASLNITLSNGTVYAVPLVLHILDDTGLPDFGPTMDLRVWPNPTSGLFNVAGEDVMIFNMEVYDMYGRLLLRQAVDGRRLAGDLGAYGSGVYLLRLETEKGVVTHKIVKE